VDNEREMPETETPAKISIAEGVSNLLGATVSSIAESVKAVASTITDRVKTTPPDPNEADHLSQSREPEAAGSDEQLPLSEDVAIALEAVPHPTERPEHVATKKPKKSATKVAQHAAAKRTSEKASKGTKRSKPKKSQKRSVTKNVVRAAKKIAQKAKKAGKKVTKKKKKSKR
jgi:methyl-accepting chemotaxis protein